jgi:hypothetical protein
MFKTKDYPKNIECFICHKKIGVGDKFRVFENNNLEELRDHSELYPNSEKPVLAVVALKIEHDLSKCWRLEVCESCFEKTRDKSWDKDL